MLSFVLLLAVFNVTLTVVFGYIEIKRVRVLPAEYHVDSRLVHKQAQGLGKPSRSVRFSKVLVAWQKATLEKAALYRDLNRGLSKVKDGPGIVWEWRVKHIWYVCYALFVSTTLILIALAFLPYKYLVSYPIYLYQWSGILIAGTTMNQSMYAENLALIEKHKKVG